MKWVNGKAVIAGSDLMAGMIVLFYRGRWVLIGIAIWKLVFESLHLAAGHLAAGASVWKVVKRGVTYAAPLALLIVSASGMLAPHRKSN